MLHLRNPIHFFTVVKEGDFSASIYIMSSWISLDVIPFFFGKYFTTN